MEERKFIKYGKHDERICNYLAFLASEKPHNWIKERIYYFKRIKHTANLINNGKIKFRAYCVYADFIKIVTDLHYTDQSTTAVYLYRYRIESPADDKDGKKYIILTDLKLHIKYKITIYSKQYSDLTEDEHIDINISYSDDDTSNITINIINGKIIQQEYDIIYTLMIESLSTVICELFLRMYELF